MVPAHWKWDTVQFKATLARKNWAETSTNFMCVHRSWQQSWGQHAGIQLAAALPVRNVKMSSRANRSFKNILKARLPIASIDISSGSARHRSGPVSCFSSCFGDGLWKRGVRVAAFSSCLVAGHPAAKAPHAATSTRTNCDYKSKERNVKW